MIRICSGKKSSLNGRIYSIVGIMPKDFDYPVPVELWVPLALTPEEQADRAQLSLQVLGRLRDGVTLDQTRAALAGFSRRLEQDYPKTNTGRTMKALQLRKELYVFTLPLFLLLQAAAGFVLLLACANLANLVFARMIGRQREIALRTALGAGRGRLGQLFLSETLLYSIAAGIVAIMASFVSVAGAANQHTCGLDKMGAGMGWHSSGRQCSRFDDSRCIRNGARSRSCHCAACESRGTQQHSQGDWCRHCDACKAASAQCLGSRPGDVCVRLAGVRGTDHPGICAACARLSRIRTGECPEGRDFLAGKSLPGNRENHEFLPAASSRSSIAAGSSARFLDHQSSRQQRG